MRSALFLQTSITHCAPLSDSLAGGSCASGQKVSTTPPPQARALRRRINNNGIPAHTPGSSAIQGRQTPPKAEDRPLAVAAGFRVSAIVGEIAGGVKLV